MVSFPSIHNLTIYAIHGDRRGSWPGTDRDEGMDRSLTTPRSMGTDAPIHPFGQVLLLLIRIGNANVRHPLPYQIAVDAARRGQRRSNRQRRSFSGVEGAGHLWLAHVIKEGVQKSGVRGVLNVFLYVYMERCAAWSRVGRGRQGRVGYEALRLLAWPRGKMLLIHIHRN